MPLIDVLAEGKRERVMRDTWGHLAPEPRRSYPGYILFGTDGFNSHLLLDYDFDGLPGNPWTMEHVEAWWSKETEKERHRPDGVRLWRWEGTYTTFKNGGCRLSGRAHPMRIVPRFRRATPSKEGE